MHGKGLCKLPGTDLTLKAEDLVQVPVWSLHRDPHHWPDPEGFIPDRFLPKNKGDIRPFPHLPFGARPRNCRCENLFSRDDCPC